jgi:hypothetical protein
MESEEVGYRAYRNAAKFYYPEDHDDSDSSSDIKVDVPITPPSQTENDYYWVKRFQNAMDGIVAMTDSIAYPDRIRRYCFISFIH